MCEDHMSKDSWVKDKEVCDRCHSGKNNKYIKHKKGRDERIAAAIEVQKDPANWGSGSIIAAYLEWVKSPEYANRFGRPIVKEEPHVDTRDIGVRSIERKVPPDCQESGAWPPSEVFGGVFNPSLQ
jgi:hypothetical protein